MLGVLEYDTSKKTISNPLSAYQPPSEVVELTHQVKRAYAKGEDIQNTPFEEFNNRSLIERMNEDQRAWLSWSPEPMEGEDDWRWNGVRPITRNKVISTAAHLTSQLLIPQIFAQNDMDEEDKAAANVMRDLLEHNIRNSNYETAFLFGVIAGLVNPVAYFKVEYCQAYQEIWHGKEKIKVADDIFSGFQSSLVSPEDVLISNIYQFDIQKQDWIIEKKGYLSYGEAMAKYGWHDNFTYVKPGVKVILNEDNMFYDTEDVNGDLIEEIVYKCRTKDQQIPFVGGVYMGGDNSDYNPFIHRTNKNKPKYDIAKFGYEPIDSMKFYYYKSLVAKMANDQEAADREWQMYFDATFLATFPPTVTMGAGKIDRSVMSPATNTNLKAGSEITPIQISNPNFALGALREAERSINESSQDPQIGGAQQGPQKTARESILLQQNAQTNLGLASKMIGFMVKDIGELMVDDIIRYQTIGELSELTGEMAYKTFLIENKVKGGKAKTSKIVFTDKYAGKKMSKEQKKMAEYKLWSDNPEDDKEVHEVNPGAFARMQYLIRIDADRMLQRNDEFERAFKLETYDRAIRDPLVQQDPEAHSKILRDFLFEPLMKGEAADYMPKIQKVAEQVVPGEGGDGGDMTGRMVRAAGMEKLLTK